MVSDLAVAADAFAMFMTALGHPPHEDAHLRDTPARVARMYGELLNGKPFDFTTFPSEGENLIVVSHIPFTSFCAHHFLPFTGQAHIAYIPSDLIAGLSKLARAVHHIAAAPQVQERLTEQLADYLTDALHPQGLGVVLQARHECMEIRGVRSIGAMTTTSALRGLLFDRPDSRAEFFAVINGGK